MIIKYSKIFFIRHWLYTLFFTILLSNCTNTEYRLPRVREIATFPSSTSAYKPHNNLPCLAWWRSFHDPYLNQYIKLSLRKNLEIRIALANLDAARGELLKVKLNWLPSLNNLAGYSTNPALGTPGGLLAAWPNYTLNIFQQYKLQQQARFNIGYYQAMEQGVRLTVIGQTVAAYFTLIAQEDQLKILERLKKNIKTQIKYYRDDIKIGLKNNIDLTSWVIEDQLLDAQIQTVQHNILLSQNALRFLIDENPGPIQSKKNFSKINFEKFKPGELPATVLRNRPDVIMAAFALKRARAGIDLAYSEFFPVLQLDQVLAGVTQPNVRFAQFTDSYVSVNLAPNVIGTLNVRKAEYRAEVLNYVKTVREVLKEVDDDFSANHHFTDFYRSTRIAEKESKYNYQLNVGLTNVGLLSDKELLNSKIQWDRLQLYTNQAQLQLAISLVNLYQDLAGGVNVNIGNG